MGTTDKTFVAAWQPRLLSILRIVTGFLFIAHGTQKLLDFPPSDHPMNLAAWTMPWTAGVLELVGGGLIILGLLTRPVAFILAGEMAVAYFMSHAPNGFWPIANKGELAVVYCFIFLYLAVAGAGAWSLDAIFKKNYRIEEIQDESTLATRVDREARSY
jgi:putative oxidoreductase